MPEWISQGEAILAFCLTAIGLLTWAGNWFWGRVTTRVNASMSGLTAGHESIEKRLTNVEDGLGEVQGDLDKVRGRIGKIEGRMEQLATSRELHDLAIGLARVGTAQESQSNMLRMLYEAAQRAEKSGAT